MANIYGGVLGVQRVGSNTVPAVLLGQAIPFATPGDDNVCGGFGGAGIEVRTGNVAMFISGEYLAFSDSSTVVSGKHPRRVLIAQCPLLAQSRHGSTADQCPLL